ncbi:hypothetical protein BDV3_006515 [Batrachochytrium dendrobatidis]|nr:suppressor of kinetochore protein mutant [Batrachochytrium dendrobatidis]KAK5668737.1 suppressor of kinetochore protein mutant [Batrachochytrium dendrobatidis]
MMITLLSHDKESYTVEHAIAERSVLLKNMLEDLGDTSDTTIPLPNVTGRILKKVVEYCTYHKNDPPPPLSESKEDVEVIRRRADNISEWDMQFIKVENDDLLELILAANYMDIKPLLDLGCMTVANMIKGKTAEEIRTAFNIENDFTPEEEEQIMRENEWAADA